MFQVSFVIILLDDKTTLLVGLSNTELFIVDFFVKPEVKQVPA